MRYAFLIAVREFSENVRTKGFWIGILLLPVVLMAMIHVPRLLEESGTPTRWFMLADQSGMAQEIVEQALRSDALRREYEAVQKYVAKWTVPDFASNQISKLDLESLPASTLEVLKNFQEEEAKALRAFQASGGARPWLETLTLSGALVENCPPFEAPRERYRLVASPAWLDVTLPSADLSVRIKEHLAEGVSFLDEEDEEQDIFAVFLVPAGAFAAESKGLSALLGSGPSREVEYWAENQADLDLRNLVSDALDDELRRQRFLIAGVNAKEVGRIQKLRVPRKMLDPTKEEGQEEVSSADVIRQWAPVGFVYLLWIALMSVVQMLLNNTIEEKSNRIVEVLLSSVTAGELMAGKLLGIAAVGLTMLGAWILSLLGILHWQAGPEAEIATMLLEVIQTSGLLGVFFFYFMMAYLLYSGIFLAIGSVCNTLKEAQNFMGPIMIFMMVPLMTMMFIPKDPHGTLATVMSWIPLYTPFVMMNRAAADPPLFDLIGTSILGLISILVVVWLSGRVFKAAILRTGQPPRLVELWRWIKPELK